METQLIQIIQTDIGTVRQRTLDTPWGALGVPGEPGTLLVALASTQAPEGQG